jgi:hypothetical protein
MNNWIGILIAIIYFANYHICELIYPNDINCWIKLKFALLSICLLLSFEYKKQNLLIEKIFLAVIFNNIYVLLFKNETDYTLNDVYFIAIFTAIQYVKQFYRIYSDRIFRTMAVYFFNKPKKQ